MKEIRTKQVDIKALEENNDYHFSGYLATFGNVDRGGDITEKGCFANALLKSTTYPFCFNHDKSNVLGKLDAIEDDKGLFVKGLFNLNDPFAVKCHDLMKMGALNTLSYGYIVEDYEPVNPSEPFGGWRLKSVDLLEGSLVTVPMNEQAIITDVKSLFSGGDLKEELKETIKVSCKEMIVDGIQKALIFHKDKEHLLKQISEIRGE